jgi:hypothetical protein
MDYFTRWPEVYAAPQPGGADGGRSPSNKGCNFKSCLMQVVLQCLGVCKMQETPPCTCNQMAWRRSIQNWSRNTPQKVMATQQRDWDIRLPIFLLAYRPSTSTMGLTPENLTFRREFHLSCHRLFRAPTTDHMVDMVKQLCYMHH